MLKEKIDELCGEYRGPDTPALKSFPKWDMTIMEAAFKNGAKKGMEFMGKWCMKMIDDTSLDYDANIPVKSLERFAEHVYNAICECVKELDGKVS